MARRRRLTRALFWTSAGAAAAYLFDPDRGRSRRVRLKDQAEASVRRLRRDAERKGRYARSTAEGKLQQFTQSDPTPPDDDRTLVAKIKSEVLGAEPFRDHAIVLDAVDGVVTLRGEVPDTSVVSELELAVGKVPGVREVRNLIHPPGAAAPNKQDSLGASSR